MYWRQQHDNDDDDMWVYVRYLYWWGEEDITENTSICMQKRKNKKHDKIYALPENRRGGSSIPL